MANGTVVSHLVNWLSPMKERLTVVTGERGAFVADTLHGDLTFHENGVIADRVGPGRDVPRRQRGRRAPDSRSPSRSRCGSSTRTSATPSWVSDTDIITMREGMETVARRRGLPAVGARVAAPSTSRS